MLGNPPVVGKQFLTPEQNRDMASVCGDVKRHGLLDYVTAVEEGVGRAGAVSGSIFVEEEPDKLSPCRGNGPPFDLSFLNSSQNTI